MYVTLLYDAAQCNEYRWKWCNVKPRLRLQFLIHWIASHRNIEWCDVRKLSFICIATWWHWILFSKYHACGLEWTKATPEKKKNERNLFCGCGDDTSRIREIFLFIFSLIFFTVAADKRKIIFVEFRFEVPLNESSRRICALVHTRESEVKLLTGFRQKLNSHKMQSWIRTMVTLGPVYFI